MRVFLAIVVLAFVSDAGALPLFEDESILEIKLAGPLSSLLDLESDRDQLVFSLHADGSVHSVKARLRGQSRRDVCDFPPIRINFNNDDTEQTLFQGQDKLKLVTHCRKSDSAEFNLLMEYAAYRIFNRFPMLATEFGCFALLMKIRMADSKRAHSNATVS